MVTPPIHSPELNTHLTMGFRGIPYLDLKARITLNSLPTEYSSKNSQEKSQGLDFGLVNLSSSSKTAHWYLDEIAFEGTYSCFSKFFATDAEIFNRSQSKPNAGIFCGKDRIKEMMNYLDYPLIVIPSNLENINLFFDSTYVFQNWYESPW